MSFLSRLFRRESEIIEINPTSDDPMALPSGFFRVLTASGKLTLGFHDPRVRFVAIPCGTTVNDNGKLVTLDKDVEDVQIVRLPYRPETPGVRQIGGRTLIESDRFNEFDGEFEWGGAKQPGTLF